MLTVLRMSLRNSDSLLNDILLYVNSSDSTNVNGVGSAGQQQRRQYQTSDSLVPTLRNWENTRSVRV